MGRRKFINKKDKVVFHIRGVRSKATGDFGGELCRTTGMEGRKNVFLKQEKKEWIRARTLRSGKLTRKVGLG